MLLRNLGNPDASTSATLLEMSDGLPTIAAFARLCGRALCGETPRIDKLEPQALALVAASQGRGMFDIRADKDAFESADRFLAVCVELAPDRRLLFRDKNDPRKTMLFLDGFRQLCQSGLIMHHMLKDFSLTTQGFELADQLQREEFVEWIEFATEIEH